MPAGLTTVPRSDHMLFVVKYQNRAQRYCFFLNYANRKCKTKSIYILCIYIVKARKIQKRARILWESYGNVMGILWEE